MCFRQDANNAKKSIGLCVEAIVGSGRPVPDQRLAYVGNVVPAVFNSGAGQAGTQWLKLKNSISLEPGV